MLSHSFSKSKWSKMVEADWSGEHRRRQIEAFLEQRGAPLRYHNMLFEKGVEVYTKQVRQYLGGPEEVATKLAGFKTQLVHFTGCYERQRQRTAFRTCSDHGLALASHARSICTRGLRARAAERTA